MLKKWFVVLELVLLVLTIVAYVGGKIRSHRKTSDSVVADAASDDRCESVDRPLSMRNFAGKQEVEFYYCVAPQSERAGDTLDDIVYVKLDMVLVVERNGDARAIRSGDNDFKQWKNLFYAELKKLGRKPQYLNRQAAFTGAWFLYFGLEKSEII